jgi:hypothetical protein
VVYAGEGAGQFTSFWRRSIRPRPRRITTVPSAKSHQRSLTPAAIAGVTRKDQRRTSANARPFHSRRVVSAWLVVERLGFYLGLPEPDGNMIISGKRGISSELAKALGRAFDVPVEFFAKLRMLMTLRGLASLILVSHDGHDCKTDILSEKCSGRAGFKRRTRLRLKSRQQAFAKLTA